MLRVRFGGFSVLKITKGLKANWVDKISHFGGTAGLLTGVSYITFFEIIEIIVISFCMICWCRVNPGCHPEQCLWETDPVVCRLCAAGRLHAQLKMLSGQLYIDMGGDSPAFEALRLTALWQDGYTSRD